MNILITGATGNTGSETIKALGEINSEARVIAAVSRPEKARKQLSSYNINEFRRLDFRDPSTFNSVLEGIDIVFLIRPPQLADIPKYFEPFLNAMLAKKIHKIVFLSVQGVENQKSIPHFKMEKTVTEKGFDYIFLRPSYFMQNLTTTLLPEIKTKNKIFIPAGNLKFTWVDVRDIGLVAAHCLEDFEKYKNQGIEITGSEQKGFKEVSLMITEITGRQTGYESPNLIKFYITKRKQGIKPAMIFVMIMLHYLPRFTKKKNPITESVRQITGKKPGTLREFIKREKNHFT